MEKTLKFNSQIATSRSQSERLLKLGLKKDTADMGLVYMTHDLAGKEIEPEYLGESIGLWEGCEERQTVLYSRQKQIPAWSLHRLIEMIDYPSNIDAIKELLAAKTMFNNRLYDRVIDIIEYLIQKDEFNKDYMEE